MFVPRSLVYNLLVREFECAPGRRFEAAQLRHGYSGLAFAESGLRYRGTSLIRKRLPLGPYGMPIRRALTWVWRV